MSRNGPFVTAFAVFGFAFLYAPILTMIGLSFNASKLVAVWAGFSTQWYGALLGDREILSSAWLSIQIGVVSATLGVMLGVATGTILSRYGPFRGKAIIAGMASAPLVMPEVITGLSLLLLFVGMEGLIGWPGGRGFTTIVISHATFSCAFVTVIIQSRLAQMDGLLEEAAPDLGARPWRAFLDVTLPMLAPAVLAGWLLAFTLSFDDLVITSFVSGPGSSTLPLVIFSKVRLGVSPEVNALATLMIAIVALGAVLYLLRQRARLAARRKAH